MAPLLEQGTLAGLGVEVGDPAHHQAPGDLVGLLLEVNAVNSISATSAREIHCPVGSSKTARG
jgi:hypothetical protein